MNDAVPIRRGLIRCPSFTPAYAGALDGLENLLKEAGFEAQCVTLMQPGPAATATTSSPIASPPLSTGTKCSYRA